MAAVALRSEERIGLAVAVVLHAALVALLLLKPHAAPVLTPPDRIEVTISDDVGLKSTSPEPNAQAAPDVAPEIGAPPPPAPEAAPPAPRVQPAPEPAPEPAPQAAPRPEPKPEPKPVPRAVERPQPRPVPHAQPRPVPRPEPKPVAKPTTRPEPPKPVAKPVSRPSPRPAPAPAAHPAAHPNAHPAARPNAAPAAHAAPNAAAKPATHPGGTRVGADFLKGVTGAQSAGQAHDPPAQAAGPQVQASLLGAISRALKPHWQGKVPEGADSEKLVTILRWNLNHDGSLAGTPQVVRQEGITDANRPQAARHAEQAIRAVQLAAPFDLPDQYYDTWKRLTIRFDKRLAQ